jgi:4-hydroxy-2-oxoheptanedioate aldolase
MSLTTKQGGRSARVRLAGWLAMPEPLVVEAAGHVGYDWVGLDMQHGTWDLGLAFRAIQLLDAMKVSVIVRVSDEDLALIPRVFDHGASGVVIAMVSSPEVVRSAIERGRYQPEGRRSYGGQRYGMRSEPKDLAHVRPAIYAMLEDRRGVEAVDEIARVPGLAGLHVGPVDLGLGLGLGRNRSDPRFNDALGAILAAGHAADLPVTMHAVAPGQVASWLDMGFDELVLTADIEVLRTGLLGQFAAAKGIIGCVPSTSVEARSYGQTN